MPVRRRNVTDARAIAPRQCLTIRPHIVTAKARTFMKVVRSAVLGILVLLGAASAHAQVQTGSISGVATDNSSAVLPGVTVSVSGDKLIGGVQTQTTDGTGAYRFDRLPPG